ncbi:unnamed protein product [Urochloa humidicola]
MCQPACTPRLYSLKTIYIILHRCPRTTLHPYQHISLESASLATPSLSRTREAGGRAMAMALILLHALLLASASAAGAMGNATGDGSSNATTSQVMCSGAECEPPRKPLPIYGYPPPAAPSLPPSPPAPPSAPGSQTPCPPVAIVCCGGAGGQYMPQQPNYNGPPTGGGGYVPYYNASASPPALLAPDVALVGYHVMVVCVFLLWLVV